MSNYLHPSTGSREAEKVKLISEVDNFADQLNGDQIMKKHLAETK